MTKHISLNEEIQKAYERGFVSGLREAKEIAKGSYLEHDRELGAEVMEYIISEIDDLIMRAI